MKLNIDMTRPLHDILPKEWKEHIQVDNMDYVPMRNLQHWKNYLSSITQKDDMKCNVSYAQFIKELMTNTSMLSRRECADIRELVRSKLLKRKLITEDLYEEYKYTVDGVTL